jgi:PAS domain S-box-containing protein
MKKSRSNMPDSKDIAKNTSFTSQHNNNGQAPKIPILPDKFLKSPESNWAGVFFNSSFTAFFLMEVNDSGKFTCTAVNDAYLHSTGFSREQVIGKTPQEILVPEESAFVIGKFNEVVEKKSALQYETSHIINGRHIYGLTSVTPIFNKHNDCEYLIGSSIDITRQKEIENDLRVSEAKYRILTENIKDVVWVLDAETFYFRYVSPSVEQLRGYTVEEVMSQPMEASLTPEVASVVRKRMSDTVEQLKSGLISFDRHYTNEVPQPCKDGSVVWTEVITTYYVNPETGSIEIRGVTRDITERKQNQLELQENELRWRSIFENSIDAIGLAHDGKFLFVNPAFVKLLGCESEEDIFGSEVLSYISPYERGKVASEMAKRAAKEDYASRYLTKIVRRNGEELEIEVNASTYWLEDKQYSISIIRDITERKEMERNLLHLQTHYQKLIENAPDGIALVNLNNQFLYISPSSLKMFGYHSDDMSKLSPDELTHPDDLPYVVETLQKLILDSNYKPVIQYRFHHSDGSWKWIESTFTNLLAEPTVHAIVINFRDINERKLYELELRRLSTAVEQNPASILITDTTGSIQYVNKAFEKTTGYVKEEVLGKNPSIMKSGSTSMEKYQELWNTILLGRTWQGELLNMRKNGESYWEEVAISPVMDENDKILNFVAVKIDIEEKKRTTLELLAAKEKSEEMNRLKSSFLANMSHELRTPMIGILGYSEILEQSELSENFKYYANVINRSGKRLMETLNLILDISRIEAGKLEIHLAHVDVWTTIKEICLLFEGVAEKRGITLIIEDPEEKPVLLLDQTMLRHIVNNLVNNAIKFTDSGEVNVSLEVDRSTDSPCILLKVSDTGIGIAQENQSIIWDEFRQVSEGKGRSFEGTGLGLSITKRFVEKLKGTISVESKLGIGSTFIVRFPLQDSDIGAIDNTGVKEQDKAPGIETIREDLPKVLYVEDDETAVGLVKHLLQRLCTLDIAYTPASALDKVRKNEYKAILMDINLGKDQINGLQTSLLIRQVEGNLGVPIVALTAFAMVGDKEEFLSSGCTHYLSKPFSGDEIRNLISNILHPGEVALSDVN